MSAASAKPTLIERLKEAEAIFTVYRCDYNLDRRLKIKNAFALAITALEAPPAAERAALKAIQEKIEDRLQAISNPKGSSTEDTLRWVLSLFGENERARAKAASEQGGATG